MTDKALETSLPGSRLVIQGEDIPFGAYQAIYHKLTKKVEKRRKAYNKAYIIEFADIQNLHERLCQVIKQYQVKSDRCQVTHAFFDSTSRDHSSFERFRMSDLSTTSYTKNVVYTFDFLVVLPPEVPEATEIAQRYVIEVRIDQDFYEKPNDLPPLFRQIVMVGNNVALSIDYADYSVSEIILSTVDGWENGLRQRDNSKFLNLLVKNEESIREHLPFIAASVPIFVGAAKLSSANNSGSQILILMIAMSLSYLSRPLTSLGLDMFFKELDRFRAWTYLLLTTGDSRRKLELAERTGRGFVRVMLAIIGIFSTIALSVIGSVIYDRLK